MPEWARLHGQPRTLLGEWPTPVQRMEHTSRELGVDVWVKREDLAGAWGGNKVRKLEFWLPRPKVWKSRTILVTGAGGSTWTAAAALHAHAFGIRTIAALAGEIPEERQKLYTDLRVELVHHRNLNALPLMVAKARVTAGSKAAALPMGGSGWPGDLGSYLCGVEIVEGALAGQFPEPRRIYVAAGTSGTSAGIAVALAHRRSRSELIAVRVTLRVLGSQRVVKHRAEKLRRRMSPVPDAAPVSMIGENDFFGKGYGKPGPGVDEAIAMAAEDGVPLEPVYTGKAFAALIAHARSGVEGPLLFVQTAAGPTPSAF